MKPPTPQDIVKAHQYLYYVGPHEVWSDYRYDQYCRRHKIDGNGGSDRKCDYTAEDIMLADAFLKNPNLAAP